MHFLKSLIPDWLLKLIRPYYHGLIAITGHYYFGQPSKKLVVVGVTGTNGKTTTVNLIAAILREAGMQVGLSSTINYDTGGGVKPNTYKMTMPSGWQLHKMLAQMVRHKVRYAVLEISSEGLAQNRHLGIQFDIAVFTNLTPEHLESHGGFENYKQAKGKLFAALNDHYLTAKKLNIDPQLKKTIITNADDPHAAFFNSFQADNYITFGIEQTDADLVATDIQYSPQGVSFSMRANRVSLQLKGQFDIKNALAAIAVAESLHISTQTWQRALQEVPVVPGRMEVIHGNFFNVIVDYAYEPEEMRQLYETINRWPYNHIIQVLGPTGGGRDKARIPILGEMAAQTAFRIFITTDDPYDDDPKLLADMMLTGVQKFNKVLGKDVIIELDRRQAIRKALEIAEANDLILVTGKGADQKMPLSKGRYIDWDDRTVVREELVKLQH
jgi:UDP-N-acetylmuramyl-tripeptide synthetase